jgi:hypothetical protein
MGSDSETVDWFTRIAAHRLFEYRNRSLCAVYWHTKLTNTLAFSKSGELVKLNAAMLK